jgi:hypothetical protein
MYVSEVIWLIRDSVKHEDSNASVALGRAYDIITNEGTSDNIKAVNKAIEYLEKHTGWAPACSSHEGMEDAVKALKAHAEILKIWEEWRYEGDS